MGSVRLVRSWVASPALQEMDIFAWLAGMDSSSTMANAIAQKVQQGSMGKENALTVSWNTACRVLESMNARSVKMGSL